MTYIQDQEWWNKKEDLTSPFTDAILIRMSILGKQGFYI